MISKILALVVTVRAFLLSKMHSRKVQAGAAALTMAPMLVGTPAYATTTDPLGGAGTDFITALLTNFTTYVIPAVVSLIVAVYAWKVIVKVGTRFLNRA